MLVFRVVASLFGVLVVLSTAYEYIVNRRESQAKKRGGKHAGNLENSLEMFGKTNEGFQSNGIQTVSAKTLEGSENTTPVNGDVYENATPAVNGHIQQSNGSDPVQVQPSNGVIPGKSGRAKPGEEYGCLPLHPNMDDLNSWFIASPMEITCHLSGVNLHA